MEAMTTVTRKGQITIPREIRRALGIREGDKVTVALADGHARLVPYGSVTARTAGILKGDGPLLTAEEERAAFEQGVAEEVTASMNRDAESW